MSTSRNDLSPEVRALLDREREILPVPAAVRARALARARAAIEAGTHRAYAVRVVRPPRLRWAVAAAVTFAAAAAVGAGAYEVRLHLVPPPAAPATASPAIAARPAPVAALEGVAEADELPPAHAIPMPHLARTDAARAELRLLRLARAAVARQDFASALTLVTEHAHRFKDGRMIEEREALRVRALAGLGRTDEARRAAQHFESRFPRSVLLPAVRQMSATP